jgi:hypothetical protein
MSLGIKELDQHVKFKLYVMKRKRDQDFKIPCFTRDNSETARAPARGAAMFPHPLSSPRRNSGVISSPNAGIHERAPSGMDPATTEFMHPSHQLQQLFAGTMMGTTSWSHIRTQLFDFTK